MPAQVYRVSHASCTTPAYAVLEFHPKDFKLQLGNRTYWISVDWLKLASILRDDSLTDHSYFIRLVNYLLTEKTNGVVFY